MREYDRIEAELDEVRDQISVLVQRFVELKVEQEEDLAEVGAPYVVAWALNSEYTSTWLEQEQRSGTCQIVKQDQNRSTSVGLFKMGMRRFV